jgi:hypothetical protein
MNALTFKDKFIKRNDEDLNLPPLVESVEWVDLTPAEMVLYNSRIAMSKSDAFMMCSHYQIVECVVQAVGENVI